MAIDIKEAVQIAKDNLAIVFESEGPNSIRLEEVVLDDYSNWIITLSYQRTKQISDDATPLALFGAALANKRFFKVVVVSKNNGEVKSIKMRSDD
ncbi:hypothetical protein CAT37_09200 [Acinetobacter pittii]|uniref:hypothetical protein n=1 Tax=Acinetobacter pittii TaxID=48296 RepID=UPI000A36ECDA|nr:hypothetical protein [Acinetobacter pittii]OTU44205.1 hypothetical protein CAT37_09200 [Acinetobacter pittii]